MAIDWSGVINTTGQVGKMAGDMYAAKVQGEVNAISYRIKAIQNVTKADAVKTQQDMARNDYLTNKAMNEVKYKQMGVDQAKNMNVAMEQQNMAISGQNRTEGMGTIRSADEDAYIKDQAQLAMNQEFGETQAEASFKIGAIGAGLEESQYRSAAYGDMRSASLATDIGKINMMKAGVEGVTSLMKANAFSSTKYDLTDDKNETKIADDKREKEKLELEKLKKAPKPQLQGTN